MFKKIGIGLLILALVAVASYKLFFDKGPNEDLLKNMRRDLTSYHMEATMDIISGEDERNFVVKVSYLKQDSEDLFRISLYDKNINQEQLLLRNNDGVFVLTPTLNQVYKFKSDWPLNSPKPYLYHSMVDVLKGEYDVKNVSDGYIITSLVDYSSNPNWYKQEIKLTKDYQPLWVQISDKNNMVVVNVTFTKVDMEPTFDENVFNVDENMKTAKEEMTSQVTSTLDDLPLLPVGANINSSLKESTKSTVSGETKFILTYEGEKDFTIVEQMSSIYDDVTTIEVDGELVELYDGFGVYSSNSLSYSYNGVNYRIYSNELTVSELIEIANGMETVVTK